MALLQELRTNFTVDYPLQSAKVGKQFQTAEERGFDAAVVVDAKIAEGIVQLKNLANREQKEVRIGAGEGGADRRTSGTRIRQV